jgi:hypothetical protein
MSRLPRSVRIILVMTAEQWMAVATSDKATNGPVKLQPALLA